MIPDFAYTNKDLYKFNQVEFRPICLLLSLNAIGLHTKGLCHSVNTMIFINENVNVCTKQNF